MVRTTPEFFDVTNYTFIPLDGGISLLVDRVVPNIKEETKPTTTHAYVFLRGGTLGAMYKAEFQNIIGAGTNPSEVLLVEDNRFTIRLRETKVDSIMRKMPRKYDTRIGKRIWGILAASGIINEKIGG